MLPEPFNSLALVLLGALAGAWAFGCSCGCLGRWQRRRHWRALAGRQAAEFSETGSAARFLAHSAQIRSERRARELARLAGKDGQ